MAPLILRPTSPAHGGAAVAREDGKVWLVSYALPGEVVEAEPRILKVVREYPELIERKMEQKMTLTAQTSYSFS